MMERSRNKLLDTDAVSDLPQQHLDEEFSNFVNKSENMKNHHELQQEMLQE